MHVMSSINGRARRAVILSAVAALVPSVAATAVPASKYAPVLVEEAQSKENCESVAGRIFVKMEVGSECVAYSVTRGFESRRDAVFFFGGDVTPEQSRDAQWAEKNLSGNVKYMQFWADELGVRYVYVSRLGLQGSSGNHGERRFPRETIIMNATVDALKERLGIDTVALAGQSGGSTIAASLMTMGRADLNCVVLGSGALELVDLEFERAGKLGVYVTKAGLAKKMYDPSSHIPSIVPRADRRVFVLGNPDDSAVPYRFQYSFINRMKAAGHHAMAIEVDALGSEHHDVGRFTFPVAGACLDNVSDDAILRAVVRGQTWARLQTVFAGVRMNRAHFSRATAASTGGS